MQLIIHSLFTQTFFFQPLSNFFFKFVGRKIINLAGVNSNALASKTFLCFLCFCLPAIACLPAMLRIARRAGGIRRWQAGGFFCFFVSRLFSAFFFLLFFFFFLLFF